MTASLSMILTLGLLAQAPRTGRQDDPAERLEFLKSR